MCIPKISEFTKNSFFQVCPYGENFEKIVQKQFLIAWKKRPDALNATQKTPSLYKVLKK